MIDEIDSEVHPLILPAIMNWFYDRAVNPLLAQLWISGHSSSLLEDLRKEEIFFTEKDGEGKTSVFGLKDIERTRRSELLSAVYGRLYGAVPRIGRSFDSAAKAHLSRCEGPSEQSYGKRLGDIADAAGLHLFLECDVLGGGDPLALMELAIKRIREKVKKRGPYVHRALLLDNDKLGQSIERDQRIPPLARKHDLCLIWQEPCHEGFLLRHLVGQHSMRPQGSQLAVSALTDVWPEYRKAIPAALLAERIDRIAIRKSCHSRRGLSRISPMIGLIGERYHPRGGLSY